VTFTDLTTYFRARFGVEEGQTMAEYGVVLAVITALVVAAILALSGAIANALDTVTGLPVTRSANGLDFSGARKGPASFPSPR
jgi:Flp pilus assembly pilin Flp